MSLKAAELGEIAAKLPALSLDWGSRIERRVEQFEPIGSLKVRRYRGVDFRLPQARAIQIGGSDQVLVPFSFLRKTNLVHCRRLLWIILCHCLATGSLIAGLRGLRLDRTEVSEGRQHPPPWASPSQHGDVSAAMIGNLLTPSKWALSRRGSLKAGRTTSAEQTPVFGSTSSTLRAPSSSPVSAQAIERTCS